MYLCVKLKLDICSELEVLTEFIIVVMFPSAQLDPISLLVSISVTWRQIRSCSILPSLTLSLPFHSLTQLHTPCLSKKQVGCRLSLLSTPSVMQYGPLA